MQGMDMEDVILKLINLGQKYGHVKAAVSRLETHGVSLSPHLSPRLSSRILPQSNQGEMKPPAQQKGYLGTRSSWKRIPKRVMDGLSSDLVEKVVTEWPDKMS